MIIVSQFVQYLNQSFSYSFCIVQARLQLYVRLSATCFSCMNRPTISQMSDIDNVAATWWLRRGELLVTK